MPLPRPTSEDSCALVGLSASPAKHSEKHRSSLSAQDGPSLQPFLRVHFAQDQNSTSDEWPSPPPTHGASRFAHRLLDCEPASCTCEPRCLAVRTRPGPSATS